MLSEYMEIGIRERNAPRVLCNPHVVQMLSNDVRINC